MFRNAMLLTVALSAVAVTETPALELLYPTHTLAQKAVVSDAVVVGKVSAIEDDEVELLPHLGGSETVKMRVAVIKVETGLIGAKNVTHVKVLIPGAATEQPADAEVGGFRPAARRVYRRAPGAVSLKVGQEGLFFLVRHRSAPSFYHIDSASAPVDAKAEEYKEDLAKVKAVVATLADPMTALNAATAADRMTAAAVLVHKYRHGLPSPVVQVAIPAEETKAILKALADADWAAPDQPLPGSSFYTGPMNIASLIGLYPGSPNGPAQVPAGENHHAKCGEAFKAWLVKSGDKFEIKKFVPTDK